jgi:BirA family biotin operon repressor/biotin-[acetyl-CoA-carboxylase] ligase
MDIHQYNFHVIQQVDSTNKYAMEMVSEGLAQHLDAWFAIEQTEGKGQRGKNWISNPGENITFSVVIRPQACFQKKTLAFNAFITLVCRDFISRILQLDVQIKWPNDLFINDRKAGGILIENRFVGDNWKWAIVGIGINVNQVHFPENIFLATSLKKIKNTDFEPIQLAKSLHKDIIESIESINQINESRIWEQYNQCLFKKGQNCAIKIRGNQIKATISHVNHQGLLVLLQNGIEYMFQVGEIEWVL